MAGVEYDCVVVGSGPNGLSAAALLARAGLSTLVVEARDTAGGGCRSGWATLPGIVHDHCATVHPLGAASPVFRSLGLARYGLTWVDPPTLLAHVLSDGEVVTLERSIEATAAQFGADADRYQKLFAPFVAKYEQLLPMVLGPLRVPGDPLLMARFGLQALRSMQGLAERFQRPSARALLAGIAAHAMVPLDEAATSAFALVLTIAGHAVGWPVARGGSQAIADALVACLREHGGELELGRGIRRMAELPRARAYLFDVTPRQLLAIAGDRLPAGYRERLAAFRYGPGVFKMDWALREAIPWKNPRCALAGTVHLSGSFEDVAAETRAVHGGKVVERPFVLLVQPTEFDRTRAPEGTHVAWAYCHVPHASTADMSAAIEGHVERFAPGFKSVIVARASRDARAMERYNANYVGGDINGGFAALRQLFFRPVAKIDPYATPARDIFLCSSSTPPGGGVHGMCGYWAARSVMSRVFGRAIG